MTLLTEKVLPARVAALMHEKSITQRQIAAVLGLPPQRVSEALNGRRRFSVSELCLIAQFFNVSTDSLLTASRAEYVKASTASPERSHK